MGMARGKVGDVVLTRLAGEQVARARNRAPKNPKTTKQMAQRAALATCVEFYTRGVKNLFKFAFESKKPSESDYNAFVRANIGIIPVQSHKSLVENGPVFGPIIMSQGSLPNLAQGVVDEGASFALTNLNLPAGADALTIGQLSQQIMDANGVLEGDIVTIVGISCVDGIQHFDLAEAIAAGELATFKGAQKWHIKQFTLDPNDTALVSTLGIFKMDDVEVGSTFIGLDWSMLGGFGWDDSHVLMACAILSRNTASGVKVSTTSLTESVATAKTSEIGTSNEWRQYVARTWSTSTSLEVAPENILQGSISANK